MYTMHDMISIFMTGFLAGMLLMGMIGLVLISMRSSATETEIGKLAGTPANPGFWCTCHHSRKERFSANCGKCGGVIPPHAVLER